jgi:transposase
LRSIVRRDTGDTYQEFLTQLAQASGIATPTRDDLARLDRKRKKKGSTDDWTHPDDPDAKITTMKDHRTHLAHKAEHAVDLETGAVVAVTVQGADEGDTTTSIETLIEAAEHVETVVPDGEGVQEVVGDKGYHSNQVMVDFEAIGIRSYISEPDRGRRTWAKHPEAHGPVSRNRRRIRGARGKRLLRLRGERLERPFAHLYETGRMRRVHLRGHENILKRVLLHAGAFNLGLLMRHLVGIGTPRSLQGRDRAVLACLWSLLASAARLWAAIGTLFQPFVSPDHLRAPRRDRCIDFTVTTTCATGWPLTAPSSTPPRNASRTMRTSSRVRPADHRALISRWTTIGTTPDRRGH